MLEHILGGRDKAGSESRAEEGPISEKQLRRITNDLLAEGFIKEEKRFDVRDKQAYIYFCVDFMRQWKTIRYKVAKVRPPAHSASVAAAAATCLTHGDVAGVVTWRRCGSTPRRSLMPPLPPPRSIRLAKGRTPTSVATQNVARNTRNSISQA